MHQTKKFTPTAHEMVAARYSRSRVLAMLMAKSGPDLKRKFQALQAAAGWHETPYSLEQLVALLQVLVGTGLMTEVEADVINSWHDLCAKTHVDDWLSAEAMAEAMTSDQETTYVLPVVDSTTQQLIPVASAWFVPRLGRCYNKTALLEWTETFRVQGDEPDKKLWPTDALRNELSLTELFALGADPFNSGIWRPSLLERTGRLEPGKIAVLIDTDRLIQARAAAATAEDRARIESLGTFPVQIVPAPNVPAPNVPAPLNDVGWSLLDTLRSQNAVMSIDFSPTSNNNIVETGIHVWTRLVNANNGVVLRFIGQSYQNGRHVLFTSDGSLIVVGDNTGTIRLYYANNGIEIRSMIGHSAGIEDLAISPDGHSIVSAGGEDKTVRIWNVHNGQLVRTITADDDVVYAVAVSGGNRFIASGGLDRSVHIWDAQSGLEMTTLRAHTGAIYALAYSRHADFLASGGQDGLIAIWNSRSYQLLRQMRVLGPVVSLAFQHFGNLLASGGSTDNTMQVWDASTGAEVRRFAGHTDAVLDVAWSFDDGLIASAGQDGTTMIWRRDGGVPPPGPLPVVPIPQAEFRDLTTNAVRITAFAFSEYGGSIVFGSQAGWVQIVNVDTGQESQVIHGHDSAITAVAFSGALLPTTFVASAAAEDGAVRLWNVRNGEPFRTLVHYSGGGVTAMAVSPNGEYVAAASPGKVHLWNVQSGERLYSSPHPGKFYKSLVFGANSMYVIGAATDGHVSAWNVAYGNVFHDWDAHGSYAYSVAISPTSTYIASGGNDNAVRTWTLNGEQIRAMTGHEGTVFSVAYSPDGRHIVSGSMDRTVRVWDAETGAELVAARKTLDDMVRTVAFSPDGRSIAASHYNKIRIWPAP